MALSPDQQTLLRELLIKTARAEGPRGFFSESVWKLFLSLAEGTQSDVEGILKEYAVARVADIDAELVTIETVIKPEKAASKTFYDSQSKLTVGVIPVK